jgi:hypothetical protein
MVNLTEAIASPHGFQVCSWITFTNRLDSSQIGRRDIKFAVAVSLATWQSFVV